MLDLANTTFDSAGNPLSIKAIVHPEDYQIDSQKYYNKGDIPELMEKQ